jgi:hypothetical protein
MPPFGNLYGLPSYVDEALAKNETILFQAGTHTGTIELKYADFDRLVGPVVARFAGPRADHRVKEHPPYRAPAFRPHAAEGESR